jgi:hypothetical protein
MKEDWFVKTFSPSKSKTYETSLFNLIQSEFGYIGGPDVVKLFVNKICELNNEYFARNDYVKPGEMRYLALKLGQKYSAAKRLQDMELVPITLTVITPEDIDDRVKKGQRGAIMRKIIVRLLKEAKQQNAVLTETDLAILLRVSQSAISTYILEYEEETGEVLPRVGSEMDVGRTLSHKKFAFQNYKKKIPTSVNARLIDHNPASVDRYIKDGLRVEKLYNDGYPEWEISFFTGLPGYLVKEYVEIVKEYSKESENKLE